MSEHMREYFDKAETYRADFIAKTESTASCSKADIEAIRQMGGAAKVVKLWLSEPDARDTHAEAGDKYGDGGDPGPIHIDDNFEIGDDTMDSPGNGHLAGENVNCRCTLAFAESG
jgi:hypothetical protein